MSFSRLPGKIVGQRMMARKELFLRNHSKKEELPR